MIDSCSLLAHSTISEKNGRIEPLGETTACTVCLCSQSWFVTRCSRRGISQASSRESGLGLRTSVRKYRCWTEWTETQSWTIRSTRCKLFYCTAWACSSAGRAPALQVSRVNHISAASGVAYAESCGATNLLNWTDVGPTTVLINLNCLAAEAGGRIAIHLGIATSLFTSFSSLSCPRIPTGVHHPR
jgi:hypothetical protein